MDSRRPAWAVSCLVAASLAVIGGFVMAYRLEPDPRGFGTHQRLGLPPCTIRAVFGIPCPSCGMTTSFANITKGRWREAARANVAGLISVPRLRGADSLVLAERLLRASLLGSTSCQIGLPASCWSCPALPRLNGCCGSVPLVLPPPAT